MSEIEACHTIHKKNQFVGEYNLSLGYSSVCKNLT